MTTGDESDFWERAVERALDSRDRDVIAAGLARVMRKFLDPQYFDLWQENGFHVLPNNYVSPIPDTRDLPPELWERESELVGIDMNVEMQLRLLKDSFPKFRSEYEQFPRKGRPGEFFFDNDRFSGTDALVLYCMIREFQPNQVIEIGSGMSSLVTAKALKKNGRGRFTCVEPYPTPIISNGFEGLDKLIQERAQDLDLSFFDQLEAGDVFFIDSSHVVGTGRDVNFLMLEVLPRLKPGVIVHIHDIFLPGEYPQDWLLKQHWYWTEQHLLQAFLIYNSQFKVLFANQFISRRYRDEMVATFPMANWWGGGSFWIRRVDTDSGG